MIQAAPANQALPRSVEERSIIQRNRRIRKKEKKAAKVAYDLFAILFHAGPSLQSGHYFSYVRYAANPVNDPPFSSWYCTNDADVSKLTPAVKAICDGRGADSAAPYILGYQYISAVDLHIKLNDFFASPQGAMLSYKQKHRGKHISFVALPW